MDLFVAFVGLVLAAPVVLLVAVWIKLDSPGPVLYRGRRVGRRGREFSMFKFRSMVVNADRVGGPTTSGDDPRVTRPGRFIRRSKVDEFPQLLNVLKGDMSLVGPRPDVPGEAAKLGSDERATILAVRPGMTDWASIRYYDEGEVVKGHPDPHAAYEALIRPGKLRLQMHYARHASLSTDVRILWATALALLGRRPAVPEPET